MRMDRGGGREEVIRTKRKSEVEEMKRSRGRGR